MKRKEYEAKLAKWEAEGYQVSELRERRFPVKSHKGGWLATAGVVIVVVAVVVVWQAWPAPTPVTTPTPVPAPVPTQTTLPSTGDYLVINAISPTNGSKLNAGQTIKVAAEVSYSLTSLSGAKILLLHSYEGTKFRSFADHVVKEGSGDVTVTGEFQAPDLSGITILAFLQGTSQPSDNPIVEIIAATYVIIGESTPAPASAPVINLVLSKPEVDGLEVTINGVVTSEGAEVKRLHWDWGDGRSRDIWFPTTHTYDRYENYTITVTAYAGEQKVSKNATVTIEPITWQKTFDGLGRATAYSVQQTSDGGYIVAGSTSTDSTGKSDFYLLKTDAKGNERWSQTFGGSEKDNAFAVQETFDDGYIIAGYARSYGTGLYLVKTDKNGNLK